MLELPESHVISAQLNEAVRGFTVREVWAGHTPHKLVWFYGEPERYRDSLAGRRIGGASAQGGNIELQSGEWRVLFQDGINLRYLAPGERRPEKHQLLIEFEDESALAAWAQMYGGIGVFREGEIDSRYVRAAREKVSPLSPAFDELYFDKLRACEDLSKLTAKMFLATGQRIPGLGNGVLQDILWNAGIHPRRPVSELDAQQWGGLFRSLKDTLAEMTLRGGRDTERDLFGAPGGYRTVLSKNTAGSPCPRCGEAIRRESYLGGTVYFCPACQPYARKTRA